MMSFTTRLVNFSHNLSMKRRGLEPHGLVQKYIDSEVLRLSDPYIPFLGGGIKDSGPINTILGNGEVKWHTPYSKRQYYENRGNGAGGLNNGGMRGKMWFERMKADRKDEIIQGAAKLAGGGFAINGR